MDDLDRMFHRLVSVIRAEFPSYLDNPFEVAELYQSVIPYRHHRRELGFETNQDYELTLMRLLAGARGYLIGDPRMQERLRQELSGSNPDTSIFRGFATTMVRLDPESVRYIESPEAARGERRPPSDRGGEQRFVDDHLVDDRGRRRAGGDDESTPEAQTVVFRRANAPAPQAPPAPAAAPSPAPAREAAPAPSPTASPITITSTGPTPSTQFTRAAPNADAAGGRRAPRASNAPPPRPGAAAGPATTSSSPSTRQAMPTPQRGARTIVASGNCHYCSGELPEGRQITFCPHCGQNLTIQHCPACSTELELGWKYCTTCGRSVAEA